MKKIFSIVGRMIPVILLSMFFTACGCQEETHKEGYDPGPIGKDQIDIPEEGDEGSVPMPDDSEPTLDGSVPTLDGSVPMVGAAAPGPDADDYKIALDADTLYIKNQTGHIQVTIGLANKIQDERGDQVRNTATVPAEEIGGFARVSASAPGFDISPEGPQEMKIVSSGSSVGFDVTPRVEGPVEISAIVDLFDNDQFQGPPTRKTETIKVQVRVDTVKTIKDRIGELLSVVWKQFLKFWGAFVALFFGVLLFSFRKYLKKKTGYGGGDCEEIEAREEDDEEENEDEDNDGDD